MFQLFYCIKLKLFIYQYPGQDSNPRPHRSLRCALNPTELQGHGQDRSFYGLFFDLSPASGVLYLHTSAFPSLYMHLQRVPPLSCFRSYYPLLLQRPVKFLNVQSNTYLGYILEQMVRFRLTTYGVEVHRSNQLSYICMGCSTSINTIINFSYPPNMKFDSN